MNKSVRFFIAILVGGLLIGSGFAGGYYLGLNRLTEVEKVRGLSNINNPVTASADFTPFWTAWNVINSQYMDGNASLTATSSRAVSNQDKVNGAIKGLVASLGDPYTVYLPAKEKKIFQENISGEFGGVGMEVGKKDGLVTVIAPLPDTPAARAGVKAGDRVLKINSSSTAEMEVDEAVNFIRGPKGTAVTITFFRDGVRDPMVKTLIRDTIAIPTIDTKKRPDGVFVIQVYNFSGNVAGLFQNALRKFADSGSDRLIIDLRGNPGGYLEAAVNMASWFLPKGALVVTEGHRDPSQNKEYTSEGYNVFSDKLKMAILVDKGSASASEIFAGALQEHKKAILVGEKTYGKGSVQQMVDLPGDGSIKLTIARWLTPHGRSISHDGLAPDVVVAVSATDTLNGKDLVLEKAAAILNGKDIEKK